MLRHLRSILMSRPVIAAPPLQLLLWMKLKSNLGFKVLLWMKLKSNLGFQHLVDDIEIEMKLKRN